MTEEQTTQPASDNNSTSTKVFVGNLSFRTRGPGLREAFEAAGKVEGVRVVTQGRRSMGYGFVQFALLDEAKKAVELLHKQPLDGREINVEISTSSNTGLNPVKRRRPRTRKAKTDSPAETTEEAETAPTAATTPTGEAPKKKPRRRAPKRKARAAGATEEAATGTEGTPAPEGTTQPRKAKAPRKPRVPREPREAGEPREPRQAREPREPREPREFSDTVLYVSNIPFALEDAGLVEAFKEFEPTSANIIRRNRTNLSKGFGFVEFADAAKQQAALDAKHKSKLGDREITVRKAHIRPPTDEASTTANATTSESVETKTE